MKTYVYYLHVPIDTSTTLSIDRNEKDLTKEALIKSITREEAWGVDYEFGHVDIEYSLKHRINECEITSIEEDIDGRL